MVYLRSIKFCFFMIFLLIPETYSVSDICNGDQAAIKENLKIGSIPKAGKGAGVYLKVKSADDIGSCIEQCCLTPLNNCDIVFFHGNVCYWVKCNVSVPNGCSPIVPMGDKFNHTMFVTVRHVVYEKAAEPPKTETRPVETSAVKECEYGLGQCPEKEVCSLKEDSKSRIGTCQCEPTLIRDSAGACAPPPAPPTNNPSTVSVTATPSPSTTTNKIKPLTVSAGDGKIIQLPVNDVSLSAFVVQKPDPGETYHFTWSLVSSPNGAEDKGLMEGKITDTVKLKNLIAGLYIFKVTVTGDNKLGESTVNVTVLPPARENTAPVAIIKPTNQVIKLPNSGVLDGSDSTDDDKIVKYHWEEVNGPLQEHSINGDSSMLKLQNLSPGNYTFKLTVTDSDGAVNSSQANVTVFKETDYPPKANAGSDVVIHLPQKSVILYGNASTDDKGIVSYEWTKTGDTDITNDVSGVRTPFLHLKDLEVGDYTFTLKVTDASGQFSSANVHIFVKPEVNQAPKAITEKSIEVVLPADNIVLDGTNSSDDSKIVTYAWSQQSGPSQLELMNSDRMVAAARGKLKEGIYTFQLLVKDGDGQTGTELLTVTTKKHANLAPVANAGGDKVVFLPVSSLTLDGSKSKDDHGIVQFKWSRDQRSLAAGDVVNGSASHAVLQLVNLVAGQYIFTLTVVDFEGLSNSDSASVIVKEDPNRNNIIELLLDTDIHAFSEENRDRLASQLKLLLHKDTADGDTIVDIRHIARDISSGYLHIQFLVNIKTKESEKVQPGVEIVALLRRKLRQNSDILDYSVISIDTLVCQNKCSGHGHCETKTKKCICDAFWMQNFFTASLFLYESNCDWSIIYVVIISFILVITITGVTWLVICMCRSKSCNFCGCNKLKPRKRHRYSLLSNKEEDCHEMKEHKELLPKGKIQNSSVMISESDFSSEEETLFINSKKTNGHLHKPLNGVTKPQFKNRLRA